MDTRTLCLGVLSKAPASGYEIKKLVEERFGFFMDVSHSAIYPALADMHAEGLLECRPVAQEGRPDKKVYRLTAAGEAALTEGLLRSPGRHRLRSEFLALLLFAEHLPPARLQALLDERLAEWQRLRGMADGCTEAMPAGARFAAGLCRTMAATAVAYIEDNRSWLEAAAADNREATTE